jgi:hypothetical protein
VVPDRPAAVQVGAFQAVFADHPGSHGHYGFVRGWIAMIGSRMFQFDSGFFKTGLEFRERPPNAGAARLHYYPTHSQNGNLLGL